MTHEGFLQAILEEPDNDDVRLIYADWLQEQGDPRGEFIHLQVRRARRPAGEPVPEAESKREQQLREDHQREWVGELHGIVARCDFERGFVASVALTASRFLQHAERIFRLAPLVRHARLSDVTASLAALVDCPYLGRLASLDVERNNLRDRGVIALAGSAHVANLTVLKLGQNSIAVDGAEALARSPHLTRLTWLKLGLNRIGTAGAGALASSATLERLERLDLDENGLGTAGTEALATGTQLPRLSMLNLWRNSIGAAGVQALADSSRMARLKHLYLRRNDVGDAGAQALAASPHLAHLERLKLSNYGIGPAARTALKNRFGERVVFYRDDPPPPLAPEG
jgi:uncharacterized protein (TIGR02996 family)